MVSPGCILYDPVHRENVIQMYIGLIKDVAIQLKQTYYVDAYASIKQPFRDYVNEQIQPFLHLSPPEGVLRVLEVDNKVAGMGAIKRLDDNIGEIRRMYIQPEHRGNGYGRLILNDLLEQGRMLDVSKFYLSTYTFMDVAQNLYRSSGFREREPYVQAESYRDAWKYLIFMEYVPE